MTFRFKDEIGPPVVYEMHSCGSRNADESVKTPVHQHTPSYLCCRPEVLDYLHTHGAQMLTVGNLANVLKDISIQPSYITLYRTVQQLLATYTQGENEQFQQFDAYINALKARGHTCILETLDQQIPEQDATIKRFKRAFIMYWQGQQVYEEYYQFGLQLDGAFPKGKNGGKGILVACLIARSQLVNQLPRWEQQ